ncbi:hypothetical protein OG909_28955 [Streptomyces sp. NBC_01754]|uniref:hypothetical protein n=1 Tax=Streptomyces sp. NBC_01754 TaxID=2975930 RepID=UPI002DDAF062|nr:hypothetical protein [Streptomyces sp. NBC_01754]WSC95993.1 hypothetical protein OG909_28955 [Streptomyces sp. NBC_01754]
MTVSVGVEAVPAFERRLFGGSWVRDSANSRHAGGGVESVRDITRHQVVPDECKAVDRVYDCCSARLAEMTWTSAATAAANDKDGIAYRYDTEKTAEAYGGLGDESLVRPRCGSPSPCLSSSRCRDGPPRRARRRPVLL